MGLHGLNLVSSPQQSAVSIHSLLPAQLVRMKTNRGDGTGAEAERNAALLLEYADLPTVFRARACMIPRQSRTAGDLDWVSTLVSFYNIG